MPTKTNPTQAYMIIDGETYRIGTLSSFELEPMSVDEYSELCSEGEFTAYLSRKGQKRLYKALGIRTIDLWLFRAKSIVLRFVRILWRK